MVKPAERKERTMYRCGHSPRTTQRHQDPMSVLHICRLQIYNVWVCRATSIRLTAQISEWSLIYCLCVCVSVALMGIKSTRGLFEGFTLRFFARTVNCECDSFSVTQLVPSLETENKINWICIWPHSDIRTNRNLMLLEKLETVWCSIIEIYPCPSAAACSLIISCLWALELPSIQSTGESPPTGHRQRPGSSNEICAGALGSWTWWDSSPKNLLNWEALRPTGTSMQMILLSLTNPTLLGYIVAASRVWRLDEMNLYCYCHLLWD